MVKYVVRRFCPVFSSHETPFILISRVSRALVKVLLLISSILCLVYLLRSSWTSQLTHAPKVNEVIEVLSNRVYTDHKLYGRNGKVVILYSNQRSGSTFVGDFFNKNPAAFYLFEPLFSFSVSCSTMYEERLKTLAEMSRCDFRNIPDAYQKAHKVNQYDDVAGECLVNNICFYKNNQNIVESYQPLCRKSEMGDIHLEPLGDVSFTLEALERTRTFYEKSKPCGLPLNMSIVSALCAASDLVAYKVLRVCDISRLESVYRNLTEMGSDVYVIHLLRDPRAIINSALHTEMKPSKLKERVERLCGKIRKNLDYIDEQYQGASTSFITEGHYLRVRHEEISQDALKTAEQIYKFIGFELPKKVAEWLRDSTVDPQARIEEYNNMIKTNRLGHQQHEEIFRKIRELVKAKRSVYGTARNSKLVVNKWRRNLKMNAVKIIQEHCHDVMERLGYKIVNNVEELQNLRISSWH